MFYNGLLKFVSLFIEGVRSEHNPLMEILDESINEKEYLSVPGSSSVSTEKPSLPIIQRAKCVKRLNLQPKTPIKKVRRGIATYL